MRIIRLLLGLPLAVVVAASVHCGGSTAGNGLPNTGDAGKPPDGTLTGDSGDDPGPPPLTSASKIDLLFAIDNSSSMADKAAILGNSVVPLLKRFATPNCLDAGGSLVGVSQSGTCPAGSTIEFAPVADIHVGVITSSLGTLGGDICGADGPGDQHGHLVAPSGSAQPFLAYGPGAITNVDDLITQTQALIGSVGQTGCGFEAQLESIYHFLVAPDPWQSITLDSQSHAQYADVDATLLTQRAAFLRPDSVVSVVLLTDENDSIADPLSIDGQGWAFMANQFPGSTIFREDGKTTTAPRGTTTCLTDPGSSDCTSCGYAATCDTSSAACQKIKADPNCVTNGGYYGPTEDNLSVRFFHMKQRYGMDPQYPLSRYVDAFNQAKTPGKASEHDATGNYVGTANCRNPLFAASLPSTAGDELCSVPRGARTPDFVFFTVIAGVPGTLVEGGAKWPQIVGNSATYDYSGIDPHMLESITPRDGLQPPSATPGDNGTDPVNGREWDTHGDDLQYACTFALPIPKTCVASDASCRCDANDNPPICGATPSTQTGGAAYPSVRELAVAEALGEANGIVGSICASDVTQGYASTLNTLANHIAPRLAR